ncbi:MAG: SUMF1/EgtB/PvdO family nonheme iron enzyme [Ignavibacteriae bacterium]|nr:SUMF1/EgtB/PvdO family nonheme iron enzyme [Ignavibacteriota bacterium]
MLKKIIITLIASLSIISSYAFTLSPFRLPDTGQTADYTPTFGEDSDYLINAPSFTNNSNGTITDNITGLIWQKTDGGEMTFENALTYCGNLVLGGYSDWRIPDSHELFSILNHGNSHPAIDTNYFTKTLAEYWWSGDRQIDDLTKIWSANAGGGIGAHPKSETISAGGTKRFHVRAVRSPVINMAIHFRDNNNGTITDLFSGLTWQKILSTNIMSWEQALSYCENLSPAGYSDWRLPNIKDGQTVKAWYLNFAYGLITYDNKTNQYNVICVRGASTLPLDFPSLTLIKGGDFVMGDHHGYVDPQHPSDELPLHTVHVDSIYIGTYELTNQQFCDYLNSAKLQALIEVRNNLVYAVGDTNIYCFINQYASYSSIGWNGTNFSVIDFRANHPVVGVMWFGAAAYCNWLSQQLGLPVCYNLSTWSCDFTKNGIRLPTEAEWEYAGRGGQYNPYYVFPWGNDSMNLSIANWPSSGDPYETGSEPFTTPAGFYNGQLRLKTDYNWPGTASSYQTTNGSNAYGLYDMAGNVWEFVNDWYGQNYYSVSPYRNPKGPETGFIMPDGKPYRGMRGGNWYNGQWGHSRVANRNPSYYRGPLDPNHPWYHVGFRVARYVYSSSTGINENNEIPKNFELYQNYPNPFNPSTTISFSLPKRDIVTLRIYNSLGQEVATLINEVLNQGTYSYRWDAANLNSGIYFCFLRTGNIQKNIKMIFLK